MGIIHFMGITNIFSIKAEVHMDLCEILRPLGRDSKLKKNTTRRLNVLKRAPRLNWQVFGVRLSIFIFKF